MATTLANYIKPFIFFTAKSSQTAVYDPVTDSLLIAQEHVKLDNLMTISQVGAQVEFLFEKQEELNVTTESEIQAAVLLSWLQGFIRWRTCNLLSKIYTEFKALNIDYLLSHVRSMTYLTGEAVGFDAAYHTLMVQTDSGISKYDLSRQASRLLVVEQCTSLLIKKTKSFTLDKKTKTEQTLRLKEMNVSFKR